MTGQTPPVLYSADFSGCAAVPHLTDGELSEIFALVLQSAGATIVHTHCHGRGNSTTCAVILTQSHAVLHTWADSMAVNIDIFSSSHDLRALEAIDNLKWLLGAQNAKIMELPRLPPPVQT